MPESLSIVIPCHNEETVLNHTYQTLKRLISSYIKKGIISDYEIVMVNNGSTDRTLDVMLNLQKADRNITILDLRRNYGYQGSITAGLFHASKNMIVSIDADLQDDPEKIEEMIEKYYEGYEMVLGVRKKRDTDSFLKRISAQFYYHLIGMVGIKSVFNHGDFRLLSYSLVQVLKRMKERNRYLRGMIFEIESKYACVYYDRRERKSGMTKFSPSHLISLGLDGITSFSNAPIRFVFFIGMLLFLISMIGILFVLYRKLITGVDVPGWAFLSVAIIFFGGIQNLSIGIIGEYIAKTYLETKQRPLFLIRKKYKK